MHFQNIPVTLMQPGDDNYLVTDRDAMEPVRHLRFDFQPGVRRPSSPCLGASLRLRSGERITPIEWSEYLVSHMMPPPWFSLRVAGSATACPLLIQHRQQFPGRQAAGKISSLD